jgi:hypothetical protein
LLDRERERETIFSLQPDSQTTGCRRKQMLRPSRTTLALVALAIVMLTGCKDPVGLPNEARMASVNYGIVPTQDSATGYVAYVPDPPPGVDVYSRSVPNIKWGDDWDVEHDCESWRWNAFSVFHIPYIPNAENEIWPCSLHYYVRATSGDTAFDLIVTELPSDPRMMSDGLLFWAAWYGDSIAEDRAHGSNGWYVVPLSLPACAAITTLSKNLPSGGDYYTGWITPDTADWIYSMAWGANSANPPFITITSKP